MIADSAVLQTVTLTGATLTCHDLVAIGRRARSAALDSAAWERIRAARSVVDRILEEKRPAYGITTGVGSQKDYSVDPAAAADYNLKLVAAHATRVPGPLLPPEAVRGALAYMANQYANGLSGVSDALVAEILEAVNGVEMPNVDASGSVGASDLVPNSQIAHWLLSRPGARAAGLPRPKETLSLINNNAVSLAQGAFALVEAERLLLAFDLAAAAALEGFRGNLGAISEEANRAHRRPGQARVAARLRALLAESALWQPGSSRFLQDPLSFRCVSQAQGAASEVMERALEVWNSELNTVDDNPVIDAGEGKAVSCGNMDTTRMTLAADQLRQALGKVADLSGERLHKQHWPAFSGLPAGLTEEGSALGGVQFLNLSHIAASLVTSIRIWARPTLLNPVGQVADGVEDTASHALHAIHDLNRLIDAGWKVAAIELMVAVWAMYRRRLEPARIGRGLRPLYERLLPLLPIGREGQEVFDIAPFVAAVREGSLVEDCLAAA